MRTITILTLLLGFYASNAQAIDCDEGHYANPSNTSCLECASDFHQNTNPSTKALHPCVQLNCSANKYISNHKCTSCADGMSSTGGQVMSCHSLTNCAVNTEVSGSTCVACKDGYASTGGSGKCTAITNCNPGTYVKGNSCVACGLGMTSDGGSATTCVPKPCSANEYLNGNACYACDDNKTSIGYITSSKTNVTSCDFVSCDANKYAKNHGCLDCSDVTTSVAGNHASQCDLIKCDANKFIVNRACTGTCGSGKYTPAQNSLKECKDVVCTTLTDYVNGNGCSARFCGKNQYINTTTRACDACSATTTITDTSHQKMLASSCTAVTCDANKYIVDHACTGTCTPGTNHTVAGTFTACVPDCKTNEKMSATDGSCSACTSGHTVAGTNLTSCIADCDRNHAMNQTTGACDVACGANTHSLGGSAIACTADECPTDTSTDIVSASANSSSCSGRGYSHHTCSNYRWSGAITCSGCTGGYTGDTCQIAPACTANLNEAASTQCNSHGTASRTCTNYAWVESAVSCACTDGYSGATCTTLPVCSANLNETTSTQCNSHGTATRTCTNGAWVESAVTCTCTGGYTGATCATPPVGLSCNANFKISTSASTGGTCVECADGTKSDGGSIISCGSVAPCGTNQVVGKHSCSDCSPGSYSNGGTATSCVTASCSANQYFDTSTLACKNCSTVGTGYWSSGGSKVGSGSCCAPSEGWNGTSCYDLACSSGKTPNSTHDGCITAGNSNCSSVSLSCPGASSTGGPECRTQKCAAVGCTYSSSLDQCQ